MFKYFVPSGNFIRLHIAKNMFNVLCMQILLYSIPAEHYDVLLKLFFGKMISIKYTPRNLHSIILISTFR